MRDYKPSIFIFVEARDDFMSCTQDVSFSLGRNNLRERVWMSQPRHVLCLSSWNSPASMRSERGSSRFISSKYCSGLNMVWMTNKAKVLVCYTKFESSMVMVMMSSMNPSIQAYFDLMSTAS